MYRPLLGLWFAFALLGCSKPKPDEVTIFAAASTREAVEQAGHDFEARTGVPVRCSPAGSDALARQIEAGADADLFLSADEEWADYLQARNLVEQRRDLLGNRLVVVTPADSELRVRDAADLAGDGVRRLAVALPSVPAGRYAREALTRAGVWDRVKGRVREGGNVREVLAVVARGEADGGFVYATDAATTKKVRVAWEVPDDLHRPIRYPLVLVRRSPVQSAARRFYDYLGGPEAAEVFRRAGFRVER